jgi:hypothetical protein
MPSFSDSHNLPTGGGQQYATGSSADTPANDAILEKVLDSTLRASETTLKPETLVALRIVAERHRGEAHCSALAAQEIVSVFVTDVLDSFPVRFSAGWKSQMAEQVTNILEDDPRSHERLQGFWRKLQGSLS